MPGQGCLDQSGRLPPHQCLALVQRKVYLVEAVLMSFLLGIVEKGTPAQAQSMVHQVLDLLWLFMEVRLLTSGLRPGSQSSLGSGKYRENLGKGPNHGCLGICSPRTMRYKIASSS